MSTRPPPIRKTPPPMFYEPPREHAHNHLPTPLEERFAIFDAFIAAMDRNPDFASTPKIAPLAHSAGRRCVKRITVLHHPPVLECLREEDEEDDLDEAESTTVCEASPVYATSRDKPLPRLPRLEKSLPPTPRNPDKALPPLPPLKTCAPPLDSKRSMDKPLPDFRWHCT
ncbi:hypothetical protein BD413DRAFT_126148 [Trametes elegans]|nr:hypothetical protein BD413DRAFT_126148 [Trametes elegans]